MWVKPKIINCHSHLTFWNISFYFMENVKNAILNILDTLFVHNLFIYFQFFFNLSFDTLLFLLLLSLLSVVRFYFNFNSFTSLVNLIQRLLFGWLKKNSMLAPTSPRVTSVLIVYTNFLRSFNVLLKLFLDGRNSFYTWNAKNKFETLKWTFLFH